MSLPPVLVELLRSDDPEQLAQAVELLRAQSSDAEVMAVLYRVLPAGRPFRLSMSRAALAGHRFQTHLVGADLSGASLRGADLSGRDLHGADLSASELCQADLRGAVLHRANLVGADLRGADLRGADLRGAGEADQAELDGALLDGALFDDETRWPGLQPPLGPLRIAPLANLVGADLRGADLRGVDLHGADLRQADLRGADLRAASLRGADLRRADLRGADLRAARLHFTDLTGADLREASLRGAELRCVGLTGARGAPSPPPLPTTPPHRRPQRVRRDLHGEERAFQCLSMMALAGIDWSGADLRGADLRGAVLWDVSLRGADLRGAHLGGAVLRRVELKDARLDGADLRHAAGAEHLPSVGGALPAATADMPHRVLFEAAVATDRPRDWLALGRAEGGARGALRESWAAWMAASGRRLDLSWGADRPVLSTWDVRVRSQSWAARIRANRAILEGSRRWHEEEVRAALGAAFPADLPGHRWSAIGLSLSGSVTAPLGESTLPPWQPTQPLLLLPEALGAPRFPARLSDSRDPEALLTGWPVRAWLWAGDISHLDIRASAPAALCTQLLGGGLPLPLLETLRVEDPATLAALAAGPPRPALRGITIVSRSDTIALPDLSAAAPGLERLEICRIHRDDASARCRVSVPRLVLPRLRRLLIYPRPADTRKGIILPPLRKITLGEVSLPGLMESYLRADRVEGLAQALPRG